MESAIRKPRKKMKHIFAEGCSLIYGFYLLLTKHQGYLSANRDFTGTLILYSSILSLDLMITVNVFLEIFFTPNNDNYSSFGWVFINVYFGLPFFSPILHYVGAFTNDSDLLLEATNFNACLNTVNIPLSIFAILISGGDPAYILVLIYMMLIKMGLSVINGKVRMYIKNPRFAANKKRLARIMGFQERRKMQQYKAFGVAPPIPTIKKL